jgi:hypothetical protein
MTTTRKMDFANKFSIKSLEILLILSAKIGKALGR